MKKIWLVLMLCMTLFLSACGKNYEKQLVGTWYREGDSSTAFTLYDDGACEIAGEYGTGSWAVVNDDQFKLTNFYGESETGEIVSVDKETFVITDGSSEVYFFKAPEKERESQSNASVDSAEQEEVKGEAALCRVTSYTDGVEDGFYEEIQIFNEKGYLIEDKDLDDEGKVSGFIQWEYDEFDNENGWVSYRVYDEKLEVSSGQEYTDYESIEDGFWRKSETYHGNNEVWMVCEHFYNEDHKLVEEVRYQDGEIVIQIEFVYDAKSRLAEDTWYYATGELDRNIYFYEQSSEKPVYMMQYNESGELEGTYTWEYDEYGRKISAYWKDAEGRLTLKTDYDYEVSE